MICEMERVLGVPVGLDETITGTVPVEGVEVVYFHDGNDRYSTVGDQFFNLTNYTNPPYAQFGGINLDGCSLTLPDGSVFYAIRYHGDIEGLWKDIEEGAMALHLTLARIDSDKLIISDGRIFELSECIARFAWKEKRDKTIGKEFFYEK